MEGEESDWEDLPDWVRDFLDKNELTELVWAYLKKRVPYDTFKNWTFEELRAIKFRSNVRSRSKLSQTSPLEPLPFLYSPDADAQADLPFNEPKEREYLIQDVIEFFTERQYVPNCPNLCCIGEDYFGPPIQSLRCMSTDKLRKMSSQLTKPLLDLDS